LVLVTTVYSKDPNSMALAPPDLFTDSRLRYTYATQRTWPCVGPTTTSSSGATTTSNIPEAGKYTVTVHVTSVDPQPRPSGYVPLPPFLGEASATYILQAPPKDPNFVQFSADPPYGSHAPVTLRLTSTIDSPRPPGMRYVFNAYPFGAALPTGTQDSAQSSYTFITTIAAPSSPIFIIEVLEIQQSDCRWVYRMRAPYKYSVVP
jgi:hypothetical protein